MFLGCLLFSAGCFTNTSRDDGYTAADGLSTFPPAGQAQVSIRLRLPDESLRAALRAQTSVAAVFSLKLINRGNLDNPITMIRKKVTITSEGSAAATFTAVPAFPVIAVLDLEGASIGGSRSFHGGADLLPGQNNEVVIVASGSAEPEDVIVRAALLSLADFTTMSRISSALFTNLAEVFSNTPVVDQTSADKVFAGYKAGIEAATVTQVGGGTVHSLALRSDGTLIAWGNNALGQLASPNFSETYYPKFSPFTRRIKRFAAGEDFTLLLCDNDKVYSCGTNEFLQLGVAGVLSTAYPLEVAGLPGVTLIAAGTRHALAVDSAGQLYAWGNNSRGQLGIGSTSLTGVAVQAVPGMTGITAVTAGNDFSMVLKSNGTVWVAGDNSFAQLATDSFEFSATFRQVVMPTTASMIEAGGGHCLVLGTNGTVYSWGMNFSGQTGLATSSAPISSPQPVAGLSSIGQLAAGQHHSIALSNSGALYVFGDNALGQLGLSVSGSESPVQNTFFPSVSVAGTGVQNSYAVSAGKIYAFGDNSAGQIGNGLTSETGVSTPVEVTIGTPWR